MELRSGQTIGHVRPNFHYETDRIKRKKSRDRAVAWLVSTPGAEALCSKRDSPPGFPQNKEKAASPFAWSHCKAMNGLGDLKKGAVAICACSCRSKLVVHKWCVVCMYSVDVCICIRTDSTAVLR
jgi:hypothetical protein